MSLEQAIEANTIALQNLLEALVTAARSTGCADTPSDHVEVVVKKPTADKKVEKAPEKVVEKAKDVKEDIDARVEKALTYDDLAADFLALVKADKPKALAILASLGVDTLKPLKDKPELYATIAAKILEALNG